MQDTIDLYTPADVKKVREQLIKEQSYMCALTDEPTDSKDYHLDHAHDDTQLVRGALHKQSNMMLGKIENIYIRYLSYWYPRDISSFLREAADYLDKPQDTRWRHPGWIKKIQTKFNSLPEGSKKVVLAALGQEQGGNSKQRKELFKKAVLSRKHGFKKISELINKEKGN